MAMISPIRHDRKSLTLYSSAWLSAGPGVLIAIMFVIATAASMNSEQTAAAGQPRITTRDGVMHDGWLDDLIPDVGCPVRHTVQLRLPLKQLRNIDGRITPNGESFFLLLARQMKSQSLNIKLTADSLDNVEFATAISACMMEEIELESTQIRISLQSPIARAADPPEEMLILTITRQEFVGETWNESEPFSDDAADDDDRD